MLVQVFPRIFRRTVGRTRTLLLAPARNYAAHAHQIKYEMDKVYLRNTGGKELYINFRYKNEELRVDRDFNFCRNMNEKVEDALARIRNNVEKELNKHNKKSNKKKSTPAQVPEVANISEISVEFWHIEFASPVTNVTFAEMLVDEQSVNNLQLHVHGSIFDMVLNQPWVVNLVLPSTILAGFAVYPNKVEMQFADREHSKGAWYKAKMPPSGDVQKITNWQHCADGFIYNTTNDDVGYHLKFELTPGNADGRLGPVVENITKSEVQAGPGPCPFDTRHCFTQQKLSGNALRVVTYNLLADLYADSDYSRTQLFPYCPPYALKIDYRKQLFMKELLGYNADVMCLQEVDMKIFDLDLKPIFEMPPYNYNGSIAQKGTSGEGVATFYRTERFELLSNYELNIGENIRSLPVFEPLWKRISGNEKLIARICDLATTLQITTLKCKDSSHYLLVANTHLYFHPDADHIRLLQIGFAMLYVEHIYQQTLEQLRPNVEPRQLGIIFCGDFNSVPECGIYKLMTEGRVDKDFIDWSSNADEAVRDVTLSQPFSMQSACGTPAYTNFTHLFSGCLDYIYYKTDVLQVEQVVPLPPDEELKAHVAIPSVVFPSDHVSLAADLKFNAM